MKITALILAAIILCLAITGTALGMSSTTYNHPWHSVSTGGGNRESANYILRDTLGQSSPVGISQNSNYRLEAGFWSGATVAAPPVSLPGDATGNGEIDAMDITKVERIIAGLDAQTPGADANQDGKMNACDITKVERIVAGLLD